MGFKLNAKAANKTVEQLAEAPHAWQEHVGFQCGVAQMMAQRMA